MKMIDISARGLQEPYNHTYSENLWWQLFKNHKRAQIQRQRQWQRQRQRQRHRQSAWKTQHMLYFWNPDDLLIPNMMIDTSPWSSCSRRSPWLACSGHTISSTGPSVSPFRDFLLSVHISVKLSELDCDIRWCIVSFSNGSFNSLSLSLFVVRGSVWWLLKEGEWHFDIFEGARIAAQLQFYVSSQETSVRAAARNF